MKVKAFILALSVVILTGCSVGVSHIPHQSLKPLKEVAKTKECIVVADIGDVREEGSDYRNRIGFGFSYWMPVIYDMGDADNTNVLFASHYLADSIVQDMNYIGYDARLLNLELNNTFTAEKALTEAKKSQCKYLLTSKLKDAKTNYWGFFVIPLFEPVWSRIKADIDIYDLRNNSQPKTVTIDHSETEWYFGKITVLDALFDAGLFGRHWLRTAWGKTVIPEGIAQGVAQVHNQLNMSGNSPAQPVVAP